MCTGKLTGNWLADTADICSLECDSLTSGFDGLLLYYDGLIIILYYINIILCYD